MINTIIKLLSPKCCFCSEKSNDLLKVTYDECNTSCKVHYHHRCLMKVLDNPDHYLNCYVKLANRISESIISKYDFEEKYRNNIVHKATLNKKLVMEAIKNSNISRINEADDFISDK